MNTKKKQAIKATLSNSFDSVMVKSDNSIVVKRGYFYQHGMTTEKLVEVVKKIYPNANIIKSDNHWAPWPRDSYFKITFTL